MPNGLPLYFLGCCERSFTQSLSFLCSWCWYNGYSSAQNCTGLQTQGLQFPSKLKGARHKSAERPPKNLIYTLFRNNINLESLTFSHEMQSWHESCFGITLKEGISFNIKSDIFCLKFMFSFDLKVGTGWNLNTLNGTQKMFLSQSNELEVLGRYLAHLGIAAVYFGTLIRGWGHPPGRSAPCEGIRERRVSFLW